MGTTITIIGLGQIGTSVGLALADHKENITRLGHDRKREIAQKAKQMGAVDKIEHNLPTVVEKADIVLLSLPLDQMRETLQAIAQAVRAEAVVMDTSPVKTTVAAWIKELLPGRQYVGLTPALNPQYVGERAAGIQGAHADLFKNGTMAISAPSGTSEAAFKRAADLVELLGAQPMFSDMAEIDGMMSTVHLLPQLTAAALLNATVDRPGWRDVRKLAGRAYAGITLPALNQDDSGALGAAAIQNRENSIHSLDTLIAALKDLRESIAENDEVSLARRLDQAREGGQCWWQERLTAEWAAEERGNLSVPSSADHWKWFLFGSHPDKDQDKKK